ncbi:MAG: TetR/AcrR family transcriptional regulator, partial [Actinomycetota bacterium]|nr:TetR/AcrR family transcriptional regulator [Actinomycetota bacterium]
MQFETGAAVDKAMDVFWRQGYAGTTPQELASALGIGKGSLYNTFENKHALFMRALRRYSGIRLEYLTDLFSAPGPIGPRLKRAMIVLAGVGEHQRGCVMVNAAAELGPADDDVNRIADHL